MSSRNLVDLDDLQYELRMLIGPAKMTQLFDEKNMGNPVNFLKDSVYLHARNLFNFFWGCSMHDASVHDFTNHNFDVSFYKKWKKPLHNHVLHINNGRNNPNIIVKSDYLNEQIQNFADDLTELWQEWIDNSTNIAIKKKLEVALVKATQEAQEDYDSSIKRLEHTK